MNDKNGMAPDLTPEEQEWARRANAEMDRRIREKIFSPRPEIREKMDSMAPGVFVSRPATKPPVPLYDDASTEPTGATEPDAPGRPDEPASDAHD